MASACPQPGTNPPDAACCVERPALVRLALPALRDGASSCLPAFKGGTFYPVPVLLQLNLFADGAGLATLAGNMPAATPQGTQLVLQAWMTDAGAPHGFAATNAMTVEVP
jgi:hypothetical protein